jgi:large subunit ribosomal protein L30
MANEELIKIRLVKSLIGIPEKHKRVIRALGLKKINSTVVHKNNPQIQGMIFKVNHMISTERVGK